MGVHGFHVPLTKTVKQPAAVVTLAWEGVILNSVCIYLACTEDKFH